MNRTKGTKRTHPKEANGTWTKVNKVHALFTSISSFGSSLFFIYWIKTKEKGVRSLTLFPLVFYSIKEQQRTSEERNGNEGTEARIHFTHLLLSLSSFSLSIKHKRKKRSAWLNLKRKGRTTMVFLSVHFTHSFLSFVNEQNRKRKGRCCIVIKKER